MATLFRINASHQKRHSSTKLVVLSAVACTLICMLVLLNPFKALAEYNGKISFAEPPVAGKHEGAMYSVKLTGDPRLPMPEDAIEKDWLKEIRVTVYNLKDQTSFDKKQILNYQQVFSTLGYSPQEPDLKTVEVKEYVAASNQPKPGDHLVAHISIDQWDGINQDFYTEVATVEGANPPAATYSVLHTFVANDGSPLPQEIMALLPPKQTDKTNGTEVSPTEPAKKSAEVNGELWEFKGWDKQKTTIQNSDVTFVGTWAKIHATGRLQIKVVDAADSDKKLQGATFKLTLDEEGKIIATSADGSLNLDKLISNKNGECEINGVALHTLDLTAQTYWLHQTAPAPDHKSMSVNPQKITIRAGSGFKTEIIENEEESDPTLIPFEVTDDPYASDIPNVYVKLLDQNVHPMNGLHVTMVRPDGSSKELLDAKVNEKHILVLTPKDFAAQGEEQPKPGSYILKLTQNNYKPTDVPINFANRTTTPIVGDKSAEHIYKEDNSVEITTDKHAKLWVTFLDNPKSEDNMVEIAADDIYEDPAGTYTVYFAKYQEKIKTSSVMKVLAQAPGKAKSEIVIVSLKDVRTGKITATLKDDKGNALSGGNFTISTSSNTSEPAQALDGTKLEKISANNGVLYCNEKPLHEYDLKVQGYLLKQQEAPQGFQKDNTTKEVWLSKQRLKQEVSFVNKKLAPTGKNATIAATIAAANKSSSNNESLKLTPADVAQPLTISANIEVRNLIDAESYTVIASLFEMSDTPSTRAASQPIAASEPVNITGKAETQNLSVMLKDVELKPGKEYVVGVRATSEREIVDADGDGSLERHEVLANPETNTARSIVVSEERDPQPTTYKAIYKFVSNDGSELPKDVTDLLPVDDAKYKDGDMVEAKNLAKEIVETDKGTWKFNAWDAPMQNIQGKDAEFVGTWVFTPKAEPTPNPAPQPTPNPNPVPDPTPSPNPVPDPTPNPNPAPAPSPNPQPDETSTPTVKPLPAKSESTIPKTADITSLFGLLVVTGLGMMVGAQITRQSSAE